MAFQHKKGSYAETYRVKDTNGKTRFLKLISHASLERHQIDENGNHYGDCTYEGCERYIDEPHNLELLEELDENSHKHICAACGYYEAEDHLFVEFEFIDDNTHEAYFLFRAAHE